MDNQLLCADTNCERLVIGRLLTYSAFINDVLDIFTDETFTDLRCREVWRYAKEIATAGDQVDIVSVTMKAMSDKKARLTAEDIVEFSNKVILGDANDSVARLHDLEVRRKLKAVGLQIQALSQDETLPVEEVLNNSREMIEHSIENGREGTQTLALTLQSVEQDINERLQGKVKIGSLTGFNEIDNRGGLHGSDLIIIAADTSQGKTSLALAITRNTIQTGERVAFYSMEMQAKQLTERLLSMESGVQASTIRNGKPSDYDIGKLKAAAGRLNAENLYFDDKSTSSADHIISSIRRMKIKHGISGAVVDYLQILNVNTKTKQTKEQLMGEIARRLKNLAKELDIWIIALSQINRDRENPEPSLSRLRDSGQIAEAADVVMLIYRPEYYGRKFPKPFQDKDTHNAALIDVAKGRNTGIYKFLCGFAPETTLFYDTEVQGAQQQEDEPF